MTHASDLIVVGTLGAVYGVKGWMRINSFTKTIDSIFHYSPWLSKSVDNCKNLRSSTTPHTKGYVAQIEDRSPEQAQR